MSKPSNVNPAGDYLRELRSRGLVGAADEPSRKFSQPEMKSALDRVFRATTSQPRPLNELNRQIEISGQELLDAVRVLQERLLIQVVDMDEGLGVVRTLEGEQVPLPDAADD